MKQPLESERSLRESSPTLPDRPPTRAAMQWLSAPKLADMLNKVMPPLKDVMEEEAPAETPQLPWTLASPSEGSDDMQRWTLSLLDFLSHPRMQPFVHELAPRLPTGMSSR